ncbi:MAG: HAD family phosphatase [Pseudomonadota bacterium]
MSASPIKNVIFDVGNVIVRWDPTLIAERTFGPGRAALAHRDAIFGNPLWLSLNRGELTEAELKAALESELGLTATQLDQLFFHIKDSQALRNDTITLMQTLKAQGFRLFALTDNVHEIVRYLRATYQFWDLFEHATVSAEIGALKPSREIFEHALNTNALNPEETVFFDDVPRNVDGAKAVGINAFVFTDAAQAKTDLATLGVFI